MSDFIDFGAIDRYTFGASGGQVASVTLSSESGTVVFTVFVPSGMPLSPPGVSEWDGELPVSGDYRIEVASTSGSSQYTIGLRIVWSAQSPAPTWPSQPSSPESTPPLSSTYHFVASTPCDAAHDGSGGYDVNATTFVCIAGSWIPAEFDGPIEYVHDDRYPLRLGRVGPHVQFVQTLLEQLGYDIGSSGADGYFGVATYRAVTTWQFDSGRPVTTVVTVEDMQAMRQQVQPDAEPTPTPSDDDVFAAGAILWGAARDLALTNGAEHAATGDCLFDFEGIASVGTANEAGIALSANADRVSVFCSSFSDDVGVGLTVRAGPAGYLQDWLSDGGRRSDLHP